MTSQASACELCSATDGLEAVPVAPRSDTVILCTTCRAGVEGGITDAPHWKCLSDAIWAEGAAAQVTAYRLLHRLQSESWARDLLDIAYLEPDRLAWAEEGLADAPEEQAEHRDSNGAVLSTGDAVTLVKDLPVKGAGFTAKRGTAVRGISLVPDNPEQIEGRVNGQRIVILTRFVKKSG